MPAKLSSRLSLLDNSLSKDSSKHYNLCLEIGISGISFAIYHKHKNIFLGIENFEFGKAGSEAEIIPMMEELLQENKWLNLTFSQIFILINNNCSTLVPLALFNENEKKIYLGFNQAFSETDLVNFNVLKNNQAVLVYSLPEILSDFLDKKWPEAKKIHYSSCVVEALSAQFKNRTDNKTLFVNLRVDSFDIIYFSDAKLFFYNNFSFKTKEDFIYFLLATMEQLGLSPEETKLKLAGKITEESTNFHILKEYIRYQAFIEKNDSYNYSELINTEISRQFYVLMNVMQCA
jgi:hypothetical protein